MSSDSHSILKRDGFIFKLGQNTSSRLAIGIFVCLKLPAVAFIKSVKVINRSRFSLGNREINVAIARIVVCDTVRIAARLGIERVEREGGFLIPGFGLDGKVGPVIPTRVGKLANLAGFWRSSVDITASK